VLQWCYSGVTMPFNDGNKNERGHNNFRREQENTKNG
jgi:hypothetical protein